MLLCRSEEAGPMAVAVVVAATQKKGASLLQSLLVQNVWGFTR
jgi:hypothetical protein